ncbi:hypothetical protein DNTS_013483 [Danionella cerebrum]|uniref:Transmembrane protein 141 n=1 Tax=Danionella cerebrum TaxID=2873325 RepID=A0A553RN17_9TELE|nr:hypothetical protein DNTS_013483 [Danionella translucida]
MANHGLPKHGDKIVMRHLNIHEFEACKQYANVKGIGSFVVGTVALIFTQGVLQKWIPYSNKLNILLSTAFSAALTPYIVRWEARKCSDMWPCLATGSITSGKIVDEEP